MFLFVFNILDENQLDRQLQFVSAKCNYHHRFRYYNASRTVDQSDATYSRCPDNWKGESKKAKKINKINVIRLLEHGQYFNVSVGIRGNKLTECVKEKQTEPPLYTFDCYGQVSNYVEIENVEGLHFDVKVFCAVSYTHLTLPTIYSV